MIRLLTLLACVLLFSVADYFAARWGYSRERTSFVLVFLIGPCAYLLFGHLAASDSLARVGAYANCGIVLATALAGVLLLAERPDRTTWIGLGIVLIGLATIALGKVERGGS
jgi:drug/metabolite transporter (DMT)-like permease